MDEANLDAILQALHNDYRAVATDLAGLTSERDAIVLRWRGQLYSLCVNTVREFTQLLSSHKSR
jgi:hypothetical protein